MMLLIVIVIVIKRRDKMRKHNILGKTIICILAVSISAVLIAGCQSKSSTASSADQTTNKTTQNDNKQSNADERKNQMQSNIDSLVTAGTITKDQGDKILEALTANRPEKGNSEDTQQSSGGQGSTQNSGQPPKGNNPLSKLVSDGTITQAQADAVMKNMRKNSPSNNNQSSQSSNNQSTTSK